MKEHLISSLIRRLDGLSTALREQGVEVSGPVTFAGGRRSYFIFPERFKDLAFVAPQIETKVENGLLTLTSAAFAWSVCLDVGGELPVPDNGFDLLPGISYSLPWPEELGLPRIVRLGNRDAVRL